MSKIKSIIYGILSVMGFAIMCWSMIPVGAGMINLGMVLVACFGLFVLGYTLLSLKYPKEEVPFKKDQDADYKVKMEIARLKAEQVDTSKLRGTVLFGMRNVDLDAFDEKMEALNVPGMVVSRETREKIDKIVWAIIVVVVLFAGVSTFKMVSGYEKYDGSSPVETLVVAGCECKIDRPGEVMQPRLDEAAEILEKNPSAKVIVTGGQSGRELKSRAKVMEDYLVYELGVEPKRIFCVDGSLDAEDDMPGVAALIEQKNLSNNVVVIADITEQSKIQKAAEENGLNSLAVNAKVEPYLWAALWAKEVF